MLAPLAAFSCGMVVPASAAPRASVMMSGIPNALAAPRASARMMSGIPNALANLFGGGAQGGGGPGAPLVDNAPAWEDLEATWQKLATEEERGWRAALAGGRSTAANSMAKQRLFDLPDGEVPKVTLYRDTASWCPYCEKVWLLLEEKRVPYLVEKVNMNCYGDKPAWFWAMQPTGGIPVAKVDGQVVRESNDIMMAVEELCAERPMLPAEGSDAHGRVRPLLSLERELFSAWFRWLTSSMSDGAQRINFEGVLSRVEAELGVGGGPFFLGQEVSLVDCMFAPFLERMAASLPYYKALPIRRTERWPNLERWFVEMEGRPSYRHVQSDFYTHVHDLPPQVGRCQSVAEAAPYAAAIDGDDGSWSLPLPDDDGTLLEPLAGLTHGVTQPEAAARREAAERLMGNREAVVRFAARGLGRPGVPAVSAELSDPRATPDEASIPKVDCALRHVAHALLAGPEAAAAGGALSEGIEPAAAAAALGYLRDRISVPRDMSYPAARQLRAHCNWAIEAIGAQAAAARADA